MASVPSYRELAQRTLGQAAQDLNAMPHGQVASAEITARAAKAQAIATVAVAQALLDIGDVLRETLRGDA
ncbi:hypothetical protein GCM10010348_76820 [Streptomyces anthocyanicus]|uniref:hypothetical protein n=1 Tax=Streptomyces anthocyanicus TaxID=68174 RepID=UPI0018755AFB|nr:hypothetical protein [Streptomyces anthocyanicus]WTC12558.1 hypothetical protein OHA15_33970 [Streptomyces anthocyanicus]GHC38146.1 hypothetical protein GCM10010348_76820 [Streptomyces anthocyanicus]